MIETGHYGSPDYGTLYIDADQFGVHAKLIHRDPAETIALAAQFPKSTGVKAQRLHGTDAPVRGMLHFSATLEANRVNHGTNEAGVRRYRSLIKHAARLGLTIEWAMPYTNSLTEQEFRGSL